MGHQDIQTTMIYAHHIPRHDAAAQLSKLLDARTRRTVDARFDDDEEGEAANPLPERILSAGGGT
jgi:hypothetical protein